MTLNFKKLPKIEKVRELLLNNEKLLFEITEQEITREYISELQREFKNHLITQIKWLNRFYVVPSISTQIVLDNLEEFYNAIDLFDKTAHSLMQLMADTFEIDLNKFEKIYELKTKIISKNQRGRIDKDWEYYFHGKGCSFTNTQTNQFLDVQLTNKTELGQLDTYYLMRFIETTDSLESLKKILNSETVNMRKVIEILWQLDYLLELPDGMNNELIINRKKKPVANNV